MTVSFLREVSKDFYLRHRNIFKNDVYFTEKDVTHNLREFIKQFGVDGLREIFDQIGIEYNSISDNGLTYTINNEMLYIHDLSSGERAMLYLIIMEKLKKPIIMIGVLDRLDRDHRERLINVLKDTNTVLLLWSSTVRNCGTCNKYYKSFKEIEEGIV